MRWLDAVPAVFMAALSVAVAAGTLDLPYWDGVTPGAAFFPLLLALAGLALSGLLMAGLMRGIGSGGVEFPGRGAGLRVALTLAGMAALALAAPITGMIPAVAAFMAFLLLAVLRQPLAPSLLAVAVVTLGVEAIFVRWLGVALPPMPF